MRCPNCAYENPDTQRFCGDCGTELPPSFSTPPPSRPTPPSRSASSPLAHDRPARVTETLETARQELATGSIFAGRYQIIEELGHGGMGRVYRALDKKLNEEVALKLVRPEIAADRSTLERFHNELKLARKISHPHVGRMYELMEEKGAHFITMEYVPGQDLRGLIRQARQLTVAKAVDIAKEICEGLAEAHKQGIVHRDLKPSNIIIDRAGDARIMDFGIARSMAVKSQTGAGVMIGTPEYMSPEQVEGKDVDARSDLYSLGIILYEMLTGRVPFEGDTPFTIGVKHKSEAPKNPRLLNPNIPDNLSGIIMRCLEKDKAKRYPSAADVRAELERVEKGLPTTERLAAERTPPTRKPFTSREITVKFQPKKLIVPALAVLAVAAAVVILVSVWPGKKAAPSASGKPMIAVVSFENKTGDKDLDKWSTGIRDLLITDLAQSKFIDVLSDTDIYGILKKLDLADAAAYSTDDLVKIADTGGAQYTVNGSFLKAGEQIIINATCQKPHSREVISPMQLSAQGFGEITAKIDEMTQKIKADLNLTQSQLAGDIDRNIGEISTPNAEAWAYYVESRRYHFRGEYEKAIPLLKKALALDPEFVMANRALGSAYLNTGDSPAARKYSDKVMELVQARPERVSQRDRYYLEQNYYAWRKPETEWARSLEAGRRMLALYPDDPLSNYDMAVIYSRIEDWDEALKYCRKSIEGRARFAMTYAMMANAFRAKGEPDKAQEVLERYLREVENTAAGHQSLADHFIAQNRLDLAAKEIETAEALAPNNNQNRMLRGDLSLFKGDLPRAETEFRSLLKQPLPMARYTGFIGLWSLYLLEGRVEEIIKIFGPLLEQSRREGAVEAEWNSRFAIAYALFRSGRPDAAIGECDKAYAVDGGLNDLGFKRSTLFLKGHAQLAADKIDEAEKTAGELKSLIDKGLNKKAVRFYDNLLGGVELARNNIPKAIEYLERAERSLAYGPYEKEPWYIATLADAYLRAGDRTRAREQYERITRLTTGLFFNGDTYALSFYHLGRIDEDLGASAGARTHYQKFLDFWKNADPGRPEVPDAKKRLASLRPGPR